MEIVYVGWIDSQARADAWTAASELPHHMLPVHSVGYVAHEDDVQITLIQSVAEMDEDDDPTLLGGISIPKAAITSRIALKSAE